MNLLLQRMSKRGNALFGELYVDGLYECVVLENYGKRIPPGTYPVEITQSPRFGRPLPLIGVAGREGIRIHPANYPGQLAGCLAPGTANNQDSVSNSKFACDVLQAKIQANLPDVRITVQGEPSVKS